MALLTLVAWPWAITAFVRWFVGQVKIGKGEALAFNGRVSWAFSAALVGFTVIDIAVTVTHIMILTLLFDYVVRSACIWLLLGWVVNHITVGSNTLRMDYGSAVAFTWRYLVTALSVFTVIGWIWSGPWLMWWMTEQVDSEYGKFSCTLTPGEFSKYVVLSFVYSLGVVTFPWAMVYLYRRLINRVEMVIPQGMVD